MAYKFLSTISGISTTFTGNSVYSNSTPNRTVKLDAIGLYLSRTSDGAYPSSITADGSMYYDTRNSHIFRNDATTSMTIVDNTRNVLIGTSTDAGYKLYVNGSGTFVGELRLTGNLATGGNRNYILGSSADFEVTTNTVVKFRNYYNSGDVYFLLDYSNGGRATIGGVSATGYRLATSGSVTASSAVARGAYFNNTLVAAANNDVLVGLDVTPTYTNGAFTGVQNIGLRVRDTASGFDQITTTRTVVQIGNNSNQSINAVNTLILALPRTNGGGLFIQSNTTSATSSTESPQLNFNNSSGQTFARLSAVGVNGSSGRLEIGVAQPSTSISNNAFFYAAANRGTTQFALGSDFTDNARAVIVAHWNDASALILKPNASTTTAPTLRVRNNADTGDNFLVYGTTGNVIIGATTDAGYKLDVNGTQRVQYGTVERGAIFTHSNGTYAEIVLGNGSQAGTGVVEIHRNGTSAISIRSTTILFNPSRLATASTFFVTGPYGGANIGTSVRLASNTIDQGVYTATSGTQSTVVIGNSGNEIWSPSSGNATYNLFSILPSINTSGTYSGIVRGFYYSPTLTSITGVTHRAIETVSGDVIFGSTSGNVGIGTATLGTATRLTLGGSQTASSAIARGGLVNTTLVAAANSDVLVGLDITPTFTNGAFTGLTNLALRVNGYTRLIGSDAAGGRMIDVKNSSNTDCFYVRGYGDAYLWQTLYLGTLNGSSYISSGNLSMYSGVGAGGAFIRFIHNNGTNALRVLSNSVIELNPSAGNVLVGTTTDAGYKLDVNGTGIFRNVLTGYVNSGSLVLGAAAANSQAITITGFYTSGGAISTTNSNSRGYSTNIGGQSFGYSASYNGNSQGFASTDSYFRAVGSINITAGTVSLYGYNFSPTITSETGATIYAFSSTLSSASNHYDLYLSGGAKNYLAGNLLIGSTTDNGNKLQVTGNITASGGVIASTLGAQNSAEVNVNESSNNLLVYADITGGSNKLYGGGQVKANIYTSSVTTPTVINTGTTVSLMEWYPTTTQGVMIDYVFYIASGNYMRSGTFTAVNDNAGNTQYVDNATPDLNGSTSTVTFAAVDNGGTIEFQVTNASGSPVYMNILTRYIPNIF
jgi:hypothetical protein